MFLKDSFTERIIMPFVNASNWQNRWYPELVIKGMQIKTVFVYQFSKKTIHRRLEREPGAIGIFPFSQFVFVSCTKFNQRAMIFQWLLFCKSPSHWMRSNNYFDVYQTKGSFAKWMNNKHTLFIAVPLKSIPMFLLTYRFMNSHLF